MKPCWNCGRDMTGTRFSKFCNRPECREAMKVHIRKLRLERDAKRKQKHKPKKRGRPPGAKNKRAAATHAEPCIKWDRVPKKGDFSQKEYERIMAEMAKPNGRRCQWVGHDGKKCNKPLVGNDHYYCKYHQDQAKRLASIYRCDGNWGFDSVFE